VPSLRSHESVMSMAEQVEQAKEEQRRLQMLQVRFFRWMMRPLREAPASRAQACCISALQTTTTPLLRTLVLSRGADINACDRDKYTPLMGAAEAVSTPKEMASRARQDSATISAVIALGVNKDLVDKEGYSAIGHYFKSVQNMNSMSAMFGGAAGTNRAERAIAQLLVPSNGPTRKDVSCISDPTEVLDQHELDRAKRQRRETA